jgi:hypothetical protein
MDSRYNSFDSDIESPRETLQWSRTSVLEEAKNAGKDDGLNKRPMSPKFVKKSGTDEADVAIAYASAYKDGREEAYKKTGSNRRRKTKKQLGKKKQTRRRSRK